MGSPGASPSARARDSTTARRSGRPMSRSRFALPHPATCPLGRELCEAIGGHMAANPEVRSSAVVVTLDEPYSPFLPKGSRSCRSCRRTSSSARPRSSSAPLNDWRATSGRGGPTHRRRAARRPLHHRRSPGRLPAERPPQGAGGASSGVPGGAAAARGLHGRDRPVRRERVRGRPARSTVRPRPGVRHRGGRPAGRRPATPRRERHATRGWGLPARRGRRRRARSCWPPTDVRAGGRPGVDRIEISSSGTRRCPRPAC